MFMTGYAKSALRQWPTWPQYGGSDPSVSMSDGRPRIRLAYRGSPTFGPHHESQQRTTSEHGVSALPFSLSTKSATKKEMRGGDCVVMRFCLRLGALTRRQIRATKFGASCEKIVVTDAGEQI